MTMKRKADDGKQMIAENIKRAAMTARIMVEDGECTEAEINEFVAETGREMFGKFFGMSEEAFLAACFVELVNNVDIDEMKRRLLNEENKED